MITIASLVYKNPKWIEHMLKSLNTVKTDINYQIMVMANDANQEVIDSGVWTDKFTNKDPNEYYINRVYRAWNACVEKCNTDWIVLVNSDMVFSDYWLDSLVAMKHMIPNSIPCSLLVESGRISSAMPEYVKNFGTNLANFDMEGWLSHAAKLRKPGWVQEGRLFMPCLLSKEEFIKAGKYPEGNKNGVSGDRILFTNLENMGLKHITSLGSVVYHFQEGEMRDGK